MAVAEKHDTSHAASKMVDVVAELSREMHPHRPAARPALDSTLDRDLGIDSLGRTELILRIERAFEVSLPDRAMTAETVRDLLRSVLSAEGRVAAGVERLRLPESDSGGAWPNSAPTLLHALEWHVETHPDRVHVHLDVEDGALDLTYRDLYEGAGRVAAGLEARGVMPGETVAIMLPTGSDYLFGFLGTLLAGGIPVPIYPPLRPSQLEEHLWRHVGILDSAQAAMLITVPEAINFARLLKPHVPSLRAIVAAANLGDGTARAPRHSVRPDDIALLQYTSGSTGQPKGVIVTHANLLANLRAAVARIEATPADVFVSWLPLYHDMGLIGAWFGSMCVGVKLVLMSPLRFLARPSRWLWAIHRHGGTISASPNFGYELCLRKIEEEEIEGLDLASWRLALNGAEPVSPRTLRRFAQRFAGHGFDPAATAPVYGLAENTLAVSMPRPGCGLVVDRIDRERFRRLGCAVPAAAADPNPLLFTACGHPVADHEVRIVNALGVEVEERQEGRLQFRGPSATSGYYRDAAATRALFTGEWLETGDRAYLADGLLYVTGRDKEMMICGGRNVYPYELEQVIGELPGIRKGCVAAFGAHHADTGTERLVVMAETNERDDAARENLRRVIVEKAVEVCSMPPDDVLLVRPHTVLKTSSGKIRRSTLRDLYERGALGKRGGGLWWQVARLTAGAAVSQVRRAARAAVDIGYGVYCMIVAALLVVPVALGIVVLPRRGARWRLLRAAVRTLLALTGAQVAVRGLEHVSMEQPFVLVANHASYLDAFALAVALPRDVSFVAKQELESVPVLGWMLERMGVLFVRRSDRQASTEDAARVIEHVRCGGSVAFFPEGTFGRRPGLLPFRMGAFRAAAETGVPVLPAVIRGTRAMLPDGAWLPRRAGLSVLFLPPLLARGEGWRGALELQQEARAAILRHNGEPDLDTER
jgi:1-acyl-sn-glycerol-3-phosphate acyltransferase